MIEKLIYDAKELQKESINSESEAQAQYEAPFTDTNKSVAELQTAVVTKSKNKAAADTERIETAEALEGTQKELENLATYLAGLHQECDYVVKNFSARQEARAQ